MSKQRYTFTVSVELEHVDGQFRSRDQIATEIAIALTSARDDLTFTSGHFDVAGTDYEVTRWNVTSADGDTVNELEGNPIVRAALDEIFRTRPRGALPQQAIDD